jgi:hypothetical protein
MTTERTTEKSIVESVSKERLMADTEAIARWVRLSGSEEEKESFDYVEDQLREMGLQTSRYSGRAYVSIPISAKLSVGGEEIAAITHSMAASTTAGGLDLPLVYVADGDYSALDARGKIVLVDGMAMPGKVLAAEKAGAAACLCANQDEYVHEMIVSPVWGSPTPETRERLPNIPVASVGARERERLLELARGGTVAHLETVVETGWTELPTLTAQITGSVEPEKFVLFSGHIDSWHYGAMDNGSANATMLEVMRVLMESGESFRRGLRVAFWSGHSHGRYSGSTWYADNFWEDLNENCVLHLNVDSVGGKNATVLTEAHTMAECQPLAADVIRDQTGVEFTGTRFGRAGDQSFLGHGVPSLFMSLSEQSPAQGDSAGGFAELVGGSAGRSGGLGWWWHTTEDTLDKIDPDLLVRDARIYAAIAYRLAAEPILPLDPSAAARELLDHISDWQEKAGDRFELSGVTERARRLSDLCKMLQDKTESLRSGDPETVKALNSVIQNVEQTLVRLDYTRCDPFAHDPALSQPAVPLLAPVDDLTRSKPGSDREGELLTQLVRNRNRLLRELSRGNEGLAGVLETL